MHISRVRDISEANTTPQGLAIVVDSLASTEQSDSASSTEEPPLFIAHRIYQLHVA